MIYLWYVVVPILILIDAWSTVPSQLSLRWDRGTSHHLQCCYTYLVLLVVPAVALQCVVARGMTSPPLRPTVCPGGLLLKSCGVMICSSISILTCCQMVYHGIPGTPIQFNTTRPVDLQNQAISCAILELSDLLEWFEEVLLQPSNPLLTLYNH